MSAKLLTRLRLAALVLALLPIAAAAGAQSNPAEPPAQGAVKTDGTAATKPWTAPAGHRQPRAADVPAASARDDFAQRIDRIDRKLDRELRICRGC